MELQKTNYEKERHANLQQNKVAILMIKELNFHMNCMLTVYQIQLNRINELKDQTEEIFQNVETDKRWGKKEGG